MGELSRDLRSLGHDLGIDVPTKEEAEDSARLGLMLGWVAKGLLFFVIGGLAVELARRGYSQEDADQTGALAIIADAPAGRVLVFTVSVGLLLYAIWQTIAAFVQESDGLVHVLKRVGWVGLSLVYVLIAATGIEIAVEGGGDASGGGGGKATPSGLTRFLFDLPAGRFLVVAVGIGTIVVGLYQLQKGIRGAFLDDIETDDLDERSRRGLRTLGTVGFAARAALLGIAGWLFIEAARNYDPDRAAGIDDSLRTLAEVGPGRILLAVCGIGLAAAGAYDMITFRRQRLG